MGWTSCYCGQDWSKVPKHWLQVPQGWKSGAGWFCCGLCRSLVARLLVAVRTAHYAPSRSSREWACLGDEKGRDEDERYFLHSLPRCRCRVRGNVPEQKS